MKLELGSNLIDGKEHYSRISRGTIFSRMKRPLEILVGYTDILKDNLQQFMRFPVLGLSDFEVIHARVGFLPWDHCYDILDILDVWREEE